MFASNGIIATYNQILECPLSDHKLILSKLEICANANNKRKVSTNWKLNDSILDIDPVIDKITDICLQIRVQMYGCS
jgi:hypothetical protein